MGESTTNTNQIRGNSFLSHSTKIPSPWYRKASDPLISHENSCETCETCAKSCAESCVKVAVILCYSCPILAQYLRLSTVHFLPYVFQSLCSANLALLLCARIIRLSDIMCASASKFSATLVQLSFQYLLKSEEAFQLIVLISSETSKKIM